MHTLPHTLEGPGVVWVLVVRDPLLLEHHPGLSEESLEVMVLLFRIQACKHSQLFLHEHYVDYNQHHIYFCLAAGILLQAPQHSTHYSICMDLPALIFIPLAVHIVSAMFLFPTATKALANFP